LSRGLVTGQLSVKAFASTLRLTSLSLLNIASVASLRKLLHVEHLLALGIDDHYLRGAVPIPVEDHDRILEI